MMNINDTTGKLVIIGSSTGGLRAIKRICSSLPQTMSRILIIQYMQGFMSETFVESLRTMVNMDVELAQDGSLLRDGLILIAPSNMHVRIVNNRMIALKPPKQGNRAITSIDIAMKSIRKMPGVDVTGIILSGMGSDGVEGITHIKEIGGTTVVQSKDTCSVWNLPNEVFSTGTIDMILTPEGIAREISIMRFPVTCEEDIVLARSIGHKLAETIGFGTVERSKIVMAISELSRNIVVHAGDGVVELSTVYSKGKDRVGLEIMAKDTGPGITDVEEAMTDHFTTAGGLGMGLGGTEKLMDELTIDTEVGSGTWVGVKKWLQGSNPIY